MCMSTCDFSGDYWQCRPAKLGGMSEYSFRCPHITDNKKGVCKLFIEIHLTTTECHLPYGITQCYLPPDTSEHKGLYPSPTGWYSIYRPFKDGGLSKPRPRVQRATGPRLLRDSPGQRDPNTRSSER